ncbi:hypothetical protein [Marinimicrobium locisalis]|uniref:hypothetical protein n=1 Tax=Marinimicrobium locisalis TaxID=546022 RepID=UPI00322201C9
MTVTVENGQYRLNDGDFQSESTDASLGDELTLQGTAHETPEETQTVTVGDYTTTFDVVTGSDTEAPEATFVFPPPMTATEGDTIIVANRRHKGIIIIAADQFGHPRDCNIGFGAFIL